MTWPVRDCPEHACCALGFPSGTLCLACGQQVLDTIDGLATIPPPEALLAEARAAHHENQGVRDFTTSAQAKRQTGATDGMQEAMDGGAGDSAT